MNFGGSADRRLYYTDKIFVVYPWFFKVNFIQNCWPHRNIFELLDVKVLPCYSCLLSYKRKYCPQPACNTIHSSISALISNLKNISAFPFYISLLPGENYLLDIFTDHSFLQDEFVLSKVQLYSLGVFDIWHN